MDERKYQDAVDGDIFFQSCLWRFMDCGEWEICQN